MMNKLPRWVEYGAFLLTFVAGTVNAIGVLGFKHQAISHLSGTATLLATQLGAFRFGEAGHLVAVLLCFVAGAAFSGFVLSGFALSGQSLRLGKRYDLLLFTEAGLLIVAIYGFNHGFWLGHYAASAACGLQNALATTYSGAIVRTTHVTGIFTDLGIMLGAKLRGETFDKRKAILFLLIISGFIVGGVFGALAFNHIQFWTLVAPAVLCVLLALVYRVYRLRAGV
ncbi:MAG: YoaK family protein [Marinagarivorans sp.]|nr:YoaK family protein [Marinagarivorans sp.]